MVCCRKGPSVSPGPFCPWSLTLTQYIATSHTCDLLQVMCFVEPRRSSRREGQPAVSYSESVLDLVDAPIRRRGGKGRAVVGELRRECC